MVAGFAEVTETKDLRVCGGLICADDLEWAGAPAHEADA
jgi:hypothetical protein